MSDDLRAVLLALSAPDVAGDKARDLIAATEDLAVDLALALQVARRQNDPERLPAITVEAIVASQGVEAAAKSLEGRFADMKKHAKETTKGLREALAAELATSDSKRAEGSSHAATPEAGSWSTQVYDEDALPADLFVLTRKPNLSAIAAKLAAGEPVPGACRVRGPAGVRISVLRNNTKERSGT